MCEEGSWSKLLHIPSERECNCYLVCLTSWAFGVKNVSIVINVAHIEEFIILEPMLTTSGLVWFDVVDLSELFCEGNVTFVVQCSATKDYNTVLFVNPS